MRKSLVEMVGVLSILSVTSAAADFMEVINIDDGDSLNVRAGPGTGHPDVGDLQEHEFVNVLGTDTTGMWAQIRYRGKLAWVAMKHLSSGQRDDGSSAHTGAHEVAGIKPGDPDGGLVVRMGEGTQFARIGVLPNGAQVHVIQRSGDNKWAMIPFGSDVGWVRASYLTSVAASGTQPQTDFQPEPMPSAVPGTAPDGLPLPGVFRVDGVAGNDVLYIRAAPHAAAQTLHSVTNGVPLVVLNMAGGKWARVQLNESVGFAHLDYLKRGGGTTTMTGFQLGIDCIGTEPFWHMTFDTDNMVRMDLVGTVAPPAPIISTGYSSTPTGYPYSFDAAPYSGQVNFEICSDGMSDNIYPMSIELHAPDAQGAPMVAYGCCTLQ